jgi:hypothetical protein
MKSKVMKLYMNKACTMLLKKIIQNNYKQLQIILNCQNNLEIQNLNQLSLLVLNRN